MSGEAYDADVVGKVFAAELCAEANFVGFFEEFGFEVCVAEGTSGLVACGGEVVVELDRGEFDGEEVFLGACSAYYEGDVVGGACGCAEAFHFLDEEWEEGALVLDGGLGHGVEVGLVGRSAAFGYHDEAILVALDSLDVYLRGEVATGVDLVVHVEGSVLGVSEVVLCEGVEYASA